MWRIKDNDGDTVDNLAGLNRMKISDHAKQIEAERIAAEKTRFYGMKYRFRAVND
jgi:hypothetical protein